MPTALLPRPAHTVIISLLHIATITSAPIVLPTAGPKTPPTAAPKTLSAAAPYTSPSAGPIASLIFVPIVHDDSSHCPTDNHTLYYTNRKRKNTSCKKGGIFVLLNKLMLEKKSLPLTFSIFLSK